MKAPARNFTGGDTRSLREYHEMHRADSSAFPQNFPKPGVSGPMGCLHTGAMVTIPAGALC